MPVVPVLFLRKQKCQIVHFEAIPKTIFAWLQCPGPVKLLWAVTLPVRTCELGIAHYHFRESLPGWRGALWRSMSCHAADQVALPDLCSSAGLLGRLTENISYLAIHTAASSASPVRLIQAGGAPDGRPRGAMQMATGGRHLPSLSDCLCLSAIVSWPAGTPQVMSRHTAQHPPGSVQHSWREAWCSLGCNDTLPSWGVKLVVGQWRRASPGRGMECHNHCASGGVLWCSEVLGCQVQQMLPM